MEDTEKPKPDPSPVRLALQKMNITRAIMIGKTIKQNSKMQGE